jgi:hypothetical protein
MPASQGSDPIRCDSCGRPASPEHIHDRMDRLQLATRYRPIHISLLLVCAAAPHRAADDLYAWEQQGASAEASEYLAGLLQSVGVDAGRSPAEQLTEFQRRGAYLARLVECPIEGDADFDRLAAVYGPVLVKRILHSYKPRHIALLDPVAPGLADTLRAAGLGNRLVADGEPIRIPGANDPRAIARVRALIASCDTDH